MTYDPDRDARAPDDVNPNRRPYERRAGGRSMGLVLGLIALLLVGGFLFYSMRDANDIASDNRPTASQSDTTGTASGGKTEPTNPAPAKE
ncbi:hypothetical protein [Pseudorhodoplanes sinuspersici]|uniref:Uncharacterized protein n=1 Tax=Pseudorhodoplanes sinuspersici TaxID=1235591 RepID=A0A1W6ZMK2_9HYPH|nr:hypothetical protein [Pseudorhodoplanes sinuspersici]ARP98628.1 hypothetical protein CAK95_05690 [Pseudorhodoplanes sinuspersici]RKE69786.1 hypothetical protein DFP91_4228 [Pseudorhodoplanes sinuspersici]